MVGVSVATYTQSGRFTVGQWTVTPALDRLERRGDSVTIEPSAMAVLVYLARHTKQVIGAEDLTRKLWPKKVVGDDAIYQRIHRLRAVLEDDAHHAKYIETIPTKGYRLIAPVEFIYGGAAGNHATARRPALVSTLMIVALLLGASYARWQYEQINNSPTVAGQQKPYPHSIAVMPFVDMSANQDQRYLGDGISEELIHTLSNIAGLRVVARTSAFRFSDSKVDVRTIGEQLNVANVLEGSVRKQGGRLRITAQLINVANGYHLWSETFDRDATDLLAVQREIAAAVAQSFGASPRVVTAADQQAPGPGINASEYYMLGRHHMRYREAPGLEQSIAYFQQAIAKDPDFARAYAGLALALVLNGVYAGESRQNPMPGALVAIEQALALDDEESEAYAAIGLVRTLQGELQGADSAFRRALELNPNYAMAYMWYGGVLNNTGREDEALRMFEMAAELDPLSAHIKLNLGIYYNLHGQPEVAREYWQNAIDVEPAYWMPYQATATNLVATGQLDQAVLLINRYIDQVGDDAYWPAPKVLIWCYRALNDLDTAEFWLDRLTASSAPAALVNRELSVALIARRDYEATAKLLHSWVSEALGQPQALDHIAWYEMIIGHNTHALRLYDRVEGMPGNSEPAESNLFNENRIPFGHLPAVNAAHLFLKTGQASRARDLLEQSRQFVSSRLDDQRYRSGAFYVLASINAIQGDHNQALHDIRRSVEAGWTRQWFTLQDPNLAALRDNPEFTRIIDDLEARLAVMRQRLRMAANQTSVALADP